MSEGTSIGDGVRRHCIVIQMIHDHVKRRELESAVTEIEDKARKYEYGPVKALVAIFEKA